MARRKLTARDYVGAFVALLVLAAATFFLSRLHLGDFSIPVAMAIAFTKATLVVLFFMNLKEQRVSSHFGFALGLLMATILLVLVGADVLTRTVW